MRNAFANALISATNKDPKIMLLTGDLGFGVFDTFIEKFPKHYINVGVAEAQMINSAAGLALEGFRPICYSIASFATARPFEQIQVCLAYPKLPVVLVGAGRGLLYGKDGPTHYTINDLALMTSLPGMTVILPADPNEVKELLPQVLKLSGPSYFTVGKYGEPEIETTTPSILGKARLINSGEKLAIFSTGEITYEVQKAVNILKKEGICPYFHHMHTVKPIDKVILEKLSEKIKEFLVIEEHFPIGGLYSAIEHWNSKSLKRVNLSKLSMPDVFVLGNLDRKDAHLKYNLDSHSIVKKCREIWSKV